MKEYHVTLVIQTEQPLTEEQQETMREEIVQTIDDFANLPLDADLVTSTIAAT